MIRSSKIARTGRIAALLAGFLSVAGGFGLHPEPVTLSPAPDARIEWIGPAGGADASPHICLACLAHRTIPLPRLTAVVLAPRPAVCAAAFAPIVSIARLESHPAEGRAPPALG